LQRPVIFAVHSFAIAAVAFGAVVPEYFPARRVPVGAQQRMAQVQK
jgi:hypothetical protein